jgi:hypothetical protein
MAFFEACRSDALKSRHSTGASKINQVSQFQTVHLGCTKFELAETTFGGAPPAFPLTAERWAAEP